MNSLLEKEGLGGRVQTVYIDPPYGVRHGSNFQPFVSKRDVKDGRDEDLTGGLFHDGIGEAAVQVLDRDTGEVPPDVPDHRLHAGHLGRGVVDDQHRNAEVE